MPDIIQIKRGLKEHLPDNALEGELLLCTDTKELFVGMGESSDVVSIATQGDTSLTNQNPVPITIGGIEAGTTFNETPIDQVLNKLLYPYVAPDFSMTHAPLPILREKGIVVDSVNIMITIAKKSENLLAVQLLKNGMPIKTWDIYSDLNNANTINLSFFDTISFKENTVYELKVTDAKRAHSKSLSHTFVYPIVCGSVYDVELPTHVNSLSKQIKTKQSFSHLFTTQNQCFYAAYPSEWGELSAIKDPNGFDITNTFEKSLIELQTLDDRHTYCCYISAPTTVNKFKIDFIF